MQDELDALRQKRLAELQNQAFQEQVEQKQAEQQLGQLEAIIKSRLTREAISRYGNIKMSHPKIAIQLLSILAQLIERKPERIITDEELKKILVMINSSKGKQP